MKVFISSVIVGLEPYRDAADTAARALRHEVKRAEDFGASSDSPQQACLAGIRWADVVVVLLGERYGQVQASGLSATHEEFREARGHSTVLAFVQEGVGREEAQDAFVAEIRDWTAGVYTASFSTADELRDAATRALHELELARQVGSSDEGEMLARASELVPDRTGFGAPTLTVVVTGGPRQEILRPAELERAELVRDLQREALFGEAPVLDSTEGTSTVVRGNALVHEQADESILLDQLGTVRVIQRARRDEERRTVELPVLIEEDMREILHRALRFAGSVLDYVDPTHRITDVVPIASLQRSSLSWRTRAEHERSPSSVPMSMGPDTITVHLEPARRHRAVLTQGLPAVVDDLLALLRRRVHER